VSALNCTHTVVPVVWCWVGFGVLDMWELYWLRQEVAYYYWCVVCLLWQTTCTLRLRFVCIVTSDNRF
jgi:hypothetical protein